jgi:hypothetical protein
MGPVEASVAVVGHAAGAGIDTGWSIERLHAIVEGDKVKTEDAEAVARDGDWLYVFGSQFGRTGRCSPSGRSWSVSGSPTSATCWNRRRWS